MRFAINCARSILIHNDISVFIVSNLHYVIPKKLQNRVSIIPAVEEHLSLGIGMKLHIDAYLRTKHSLFIDSDCICYGALTDIFKACEDTDVSAVGNIVPTEHWCGAEIAKTIQGNWNLKEIMRFNGGLYYIKKSQCSTNIFRKAREIAQNYDEYGFLRINGKWINEEVPLSISMMLYKQKPMKDNGYFMTDLYTDQRPTRINVVKGIRLLRNPTVNLPKHRAWYPKEYSPIVLHFGGNNISSYPYNSQSLLLKFHEIPILSFTANWLINIFVHLPYRTYHWINGRLIELKGR